MLEKGYVAFFNPISDLLERLCIDRVPVMELWHLLEFGDVTLKSEVIQMLFEAPIEAAMEGNAVVEHGTAGRKL